MKIMDKTFARTVFAAAAVAATVGTLSLGAFAEGDDVIVAGYLPPQEQMVQGDIALHAAGAEQPVADSTYGGYGAPEGDLIQGDIMLISLPDEAAGRVATDTLPDSAPAEIPEAEKVPVAAGLTMKGLFCKQVLFTARQSGRVLTLAAPDDNITLRGTVGDLRAQMTRGVGTLSVTSGKKTTNLNLTLLCDGYDDNARVVLRHIGDYTLLTVNGRSRRDLLTAR